MIKNKTDTYIASSYTKFNLELVRGEGALLFDSDGNSYIDLGSGIAVNSFGSSDPEWVAAVTAQLQTLAHTSNLYYTEPQAKLAEQLCTRTGMKRVFFSNSGAEANECAIKVARKYANDNNGKPNIITLKGSFHGRTITTLAATGQEAFHTHFMPFTEGFSHIEAGDLDALEAHLKKGAAAFMVELIQGESGVLPLDKAFVEAAAKLCAQYNSLFIVDEVQTGIGRTGKLFCFEHYNITPDIVTVAKGLGGGLPIGAAILGEKVAETLTPGTHGSTFGGNPVCAAGAVNVIERIDDKLLDEVTKKGEYIKTQLEACTNVKGITGIGLMLGITTTKPAKEIAEKCQEKGVLVLTAKEKLRLLPPLNISRELLEKAIEIVKTVIDS